jgi:hypothetical protein
LAVSLSALEYFYDIWPDTVDDQRVPAETAALVRDESARAASTTPTAVRVDSSLAGHSCAYGFGVVVADACRSRARTTSTSAPEAISSDAIACRAEGWSAVERRLTRGRTASPAASRCRLGTVSGGPMACEFIDHGQERLEPNPA